jgi:DNA-binding NarL/FixJ family response regulator
MKQPQAQSKVLVVEDEPLILGFIVQMLQGNGFNVRSAANAAEARKISDEFHPDVAILDIELGNGPSGFDLAVVLRHNLPEIAIVFLTHIPEPRVVGLDSRHLPANSAYLVKDRMTDPALLIKAIDGAVRKTVRRKFRDDKNVPHSLSAVSKNQMDVLRMVALGLSNSQIAAERGTTIRAVENLVNRAFAAAGIDVDSEENPRVAAARAFIKVAGLPHGK